MRRPFALAYGLVGYAAFGVTFAALIDFVAGTGYVRAIDSPPTAPLAVALVIDLALVAAFGLVHSLLARPPIKAAVIRVVGAACERSTYVLVASAQLLLLVWQWRAVPDGVWALDAPMARAAVWIVQGLAIAIVVYSTFLTDHFDLLGLRQTWFAAQGRTHTPVPFVERSLYRCMRHPLMVGIVLWFWATPTMSIGHLVFAVSMTVYVGIGVAFEERGLSRALGEPYDDYRRRVRMFLPFRRG
jgi:protein-S-isoprenylcysteine O-methyltransferase Ste14